MTGTHGVDGFLPLHPEVFRILVVLRSGERHGYALVKELERDPGRPGKVLPANLYRRIRTLLDQGLIEESGNRPDPEVDDQRRRYFAVTPLGEAVAQAEVTPFFDAASNTFSYVVRDPGSTACAIIDSVLDYDAAAGRTVTTAADGSERRSPHLALTSGCLRFGPTVSS